MDIQGSVTAKSIITAGVRVNEGFNTQTLLGDFDLSKHSHKTQYYFTQEDRVVTLPDATTLPSGWSISFFSNKLSTGTVFINDKDGNEQYKVKPNKSVSLILLDNTTQAGVWKVIESGSGTGAGDRNITILSEEPLFSVEGTSVNVNRFVASVSNGFEEDGAAIEEIIEFPGGSALTNPDSFPKTSYVYLTLEGVLIQEDAKQDGGNDFPENPSTGDIFYNKQLRKNFKYEENEWVDYPCVAVGEVTWTSDTEIKTTTYTFNEWWWDFVEFTPLVSHVQRFINNEEVTTQIVLDTKCEDKNYLTINVSNTVLMADTYDLASDGVTVSFINAIEAGIPIEAKWYIPVSAVSVTTTGANTDLSNLTAVGNEKLLPIGGNVGDVIVRSENGARWAPTTGMTIGTVFMSDLVAPNIPAGALEYNGTEVTQADEQYPEFWSNWLTVGKFATVSYSRYATELSNNNGTCAFYALDTVNKKFKTPTWADGVFPSSAKTASEVNTYKKAGLPEHDHIMHGKGAIAGSIYLSNNAASYGRSGGETVGKSSTPATTMRTGDASESNQIYGASDTVQPVSVRKRWFVQVANAVETTAYQNVDVALQSKVNKSGDTMTGALKIPTANINSKDTTAINSEWYVNKYQSNITNCITKIPQDIKLELSADGTLTFNGNIYIPNGVNNFEKKAVSASRKLLGQAVEGEYLLYVNESAFLTANNKSYSGSTAPEDTYCFWYDTTSNKIKYKGSSSEDWIEYNTCFPIAKIYMTSAGVTSILQVFKGFGYIGSTVFALPGVEGLVPNGRHADGSLNNTRFTVSQVLLKNAPTSVNGYITLNSNAISSPPVSTYSYNSDNNLNYFLGNRVYDAIVGVYISDANGKITSFNPKTAFHAVDYFDYDSRVSDIGDSKVSKTGDTMTGALKVPTPASTTNDTTVPTTEWVRNLLEQEKTKLMGIPNTKAGVAFTVSRSVSDSGIQYSVPANGIIVINSASSGSDDIPVLLINGNNVGDPNTTASHIHMVLSGDTIYTPKTSNMYSATVIKGIFFPYL